MLVLSSGDEEEEVRRSTQAPAKAGRPAKGKVSNSMILRRNLLNEGHLM